MGGRPIFAVPDGPTQLRLAGLARYQPYTFRRTLYRRGMGLAIRTQLDQMLCTKAGSPLGDSSPFIFAGWLEQIGAELDEPKVLPAIFWPTHQDRQRLYVHLFDERLNQIGFAKIAMDSNNAVLLQREAEVLRELARIKSNRFSVPRVISQGEFAGHQYLVAQPLPTDAVPLGSNPAFPSECVKEYSGPVTTVPAHSVPTLSWWPTFVGQLRAIDEPILAEIEQIAGQEPIEVARAHGDFGPANIVSTPDRLWIFDWEASSADAPAHADRLSFELETTYIQAGARSEGERAGIQEGLLDNMEDDRRPQTLLGLAYIRTIHRSGFHWLTR